MRLLDILANAGADLDLRLDHFRLDLFAQEHAALVENLRHVRPQLARLRIDDLKFLFDAECKLIEHGFGRVFPGRRYSTKSFISCQSGLNLRHRSRNKCRPRAEIEPNGPYKSR